MDVKGKFPNGLGVAMRDAGIGITELARRVGSNKQTIERYQKQTRKIPLEMGERIGRALDRSPTEIVMPPGTLKSLERVRLISWISAGRLGQREFQDEDLGSVLVAGLPKGDWFAFRVEGDSMDRISPPNSIILVNRRDKKLVPNACYVVLDEDGSATYKRYRPKPDRFEPVSTNKDLEAIYPKETPQIFGRVMKTILDL